MHFFKSLLLIVISVIGIYRISDQIPQKQTGVNTGVNIHIGDIATSNILKKASSQLGITMESQAHIGHFRICVFVYNLTDKQFMTDLAFLFDHGDRPVGFYWQEIEGRSSAWMLRQTPSSRNHEIAKINEVDRLGAQWLREYWQAYNLKDEDREKAAAKAISPAFSASGPDDAPTEALAALTSSELNQLLSGQNVHIPLSRFSPGTATLLRERTRPSTDPAASAKDITVQVSFGRSSDTRGTYHMSVDTLPHSQTIQNGILMDPLGIVNSPDNRVARLLNEGEASPEIDISTAITQLPREEQMNMNARLQAISRIAKVNILCEFFPTTQFAMSRLQNKGKLHTILNDIARLYSYDVVKQGNTYFLWSRVWFNDRPNTVPDSIVASCRDRINKKRPFKIDEIITISRLTDGQLELLLRMPLQITFNTFSVRIFRLYNILTVSQRDTALSERGLPTTSLTERQRGEWISLLGSSSVAARSLQQNNFRGTFFLKRNEDKRNRAFYQIVLVDQQGNRIIETALPL